MSTNTKSITLASEVDALQIADSAAIAALKSPTLKTAMTALCNGEVLMVATAQKTAATVADIRRKQATALGTVTDDVLKKCGYKTLSALLDEVKLNDASRQTVSQCKAAGIVYNDPDAPENLKGMSVSKLGQMGALIRDKDAYAALKADATVSDAMTLDEVKNYVATHRPLTAKTLPTFGCMSKGVYIKQDGEPLCQTVDEWKNFFSGEFVTAPADGQGRKRFITVSPDEVCTLYTLVKRENSPKPKEESKPKMSIADMAAFLGVSVEQLTALKEANK